MSYFYSFSNIMEKVQKMKVILLGRVNVGKTNIISKYVKNYFDTKRSGTFSVSYEIKTITTRGGNKLSLIIWDTAGPTRYQPVTEYYMKYSSVGIFVYSPFSENLLTNYLGM